MPHKFGNKVWSTVLAITLATLPVTYSSAVAQTQPTQQKGQQSAEQPIEALVSALLATKDEAQRESLLAEQKALLNKELSDRLTFRGKSLSLKNDFEGASKSYQLARTIAERINYPKGIIAAITEIGALQTSRGNAKAALEIYEQALRLTEQHDEKSLSAALQLNMCAAQIGLSNLDQAAINCRLCLTLAEKDGDQGLQAKAYTNLGINARQRGDAAAASEFLLNGMARLEALGDKRGLVRSLTSLGVLYKEAENLTAALRYYSRALTVAEEVGDKVGIAGTLSNLSSVYRSLGNYRLALDFSQRSLALAESLGNKPIISIATGAIGEIHMHRSEFTQALEYSLKSLKLAEQTGDQRRVAIRLEYLGMVYLRMKDYDQALSYFQRSLDLAKSIKVPFSVLYSQKWIAYTYLKQGKPREALDWAEQSLALFQKNPAVKTPWESSQFAGMAYSALNQPEAARQKLEEAINLIEFERDGLSANENDQAAFAAFRTSPYLRLVTLLTEQGQMAEAFRYLERAKARTLLNVLQSGKTSVSKAMTAAEKEQEKRLRDEMAALNAQLRRITQTQQPDVAAISTAKTNLEKARLAYEAFQTQLYLTHPTLKAQRGEAPALNLGEVSALLPHANVAALEFMVSDEVVYLFVLTQGARGVEIKAYPLAIKRDELNPLIRKFRQQLASLDLQFRSTARQLYDILLKPAQAQLAGKTQLVIVPDDALWELPYQALVTSKNQYLIETAAVSYAPSLTVLREMQTQRARRGKPTGSLLAFGNPSFGQETIQRVELAYRDEKLVPLPEAEAEVKALGQLYGSRSKIYVHAAAGEARLKAEAAEAGILHIATHGVLNDAAPMYSHLALATNNDKEDGLVEAWELMQLDLKADLAVLSACETARGQIGNGEGVIGLSWALFVAGVPSTLVSQWKVESSSTRDLMLGFHRNLKGTSAKPGAPKAEALRRAVLPLLKKPATNHPFYWAGFVLIGAE
jgi:CHAT domain-containing protein/tetratricopeptide (TPR) repeat protein